MTQLAINMHTSQVAHGVITDEHYLADDVNVVRVGYTISMVHLHLYVAGNPVAQAYWYSHEPDVMMLYEDGQAPLDVPAFIEVGEKEFYIDGTAVDATLHGTADAVRWQVDGCHNDNSYRNNMHPDPQSGDSAMPWINPHLPEVQGETLSSETDIEPVLGADYVTDVSLGTMTLTVAASTTVAQLIDDLQSTDGSTQTYNVYADDTGPDLTAEKTDTDALVTGDWLVVTAEDGTTAEYEITVSA